MEFTNFKELVRDEVAKRTGEQYNVRINEVMKNNGVVLSGITMMKDGSNISPTIYLNDYYQAYESGQTSLKSIIEEVLETYERNKVHRSFDMKFFMNYESVKDRIIFKLIHAERNVALLEDVPHIRFLDLAIVFQCLVSEETLGNATILIHNAHIRIWEKTKEELLEQALINTPKLQRYDIRNMRDILCEMIMREHEGSNEDFDREECLKGLPDSIPMYVLSNRARIQGASCMLYPDILKDFAQAIGKDFFILPSSVHEVILLPAQGNEDGDALKNMVHEVNETQVEREEVLSDSVYFFEHKTGELHLL